MIRQSLRRLSFYFTKGGDRMARADINDWLTDEGLILIEGWARDGLTDEQIAENMGISRTTLYNWKN